MTSRLVAPARRTRVHVAGVAAVVVALAGSALAASITGWAVGTSLMLAAVVIAAIAGATVLWRQRFGEGGAARSSIVGLAAVAAVAVVVAAGLSWQHVVSQRVDDGERHQIANSAADITQLLITVTPESRGAYVERLRPVAVTGMPDIAKTEILDRIPEGNQQTGTVRAVGVREATADQASVTVVVDQTGPGALARDDGAPNQMILSLRLKHLDGQWKLAAVSAATT